MDRNVFLASLAMIGALSGCSTSHSFFAGNACIDHSISRSESSSRCDVQETSEPLLLSNVEACCPPVCCDGSCSCGECVTGEGCNGCTGEGRRSRSLTGLKGGFERGRKNIVLDGAGWIAGIPSKLLLWNAKVDSHSVSPETEQQLRRYLASRGMTDVMVRINQYDPLGEWKRLANNKHIHPGWRYTVGALHLTRYTLTPGRLFGNDEYNPFTHSISLYSDRTSIALREGARAKHTLEATYPGLWSASSYLPGSPLWIDTPAIREVLAYSQQTNQRKLERESFLVLFPAFGARMGSSATLMLDASIGQATQAGFALIGHAVGRTMAIRVSEGPVEIVKSAYGIVKKRPPEDDVWSSEPEQTAELQNPLPYNGEFDVTFVPVDVIYDSLN